jgi:hypothetical protein
MMGQEGNAPEMSVVIVTPDSYGVIRRTIRYLRAQSVKDCLEIVIGAPSRDQLGLIESDLEGFHSYKVVEVGEIRILAKAKVATVVASSAPIVAFAEDHCYPEPGWAEALIATHRRGYAAVGPLIRNANPATLLSWAGLLLHYGCCIQPTLSGKCTNLPWHNTSYKRQLLLEYGPELASMLIVEGILFDDLRAKGHILHFEPAAQTNHVNISILSSLIRHAFWGGRLFGAMRAQKNNWPVWKRLVYIAGSPLIPIMRLYKTVRRGREVGKDALLPRLIPAVLAGLLPHAMGEVTGYALGVGRAAERSSYFEMKRFLHVVPTDQQIMFE